MNIFFDCETYATNMPFYRDKVWSDIRDEVQALKAPGNYKDPTKIAAWKHEKTIEIESSYEDRINKTAVDTSLATIICIGYAIDDGQVQTIIGTESDILKNFFLIAIEGHRYVNLVGHNIIDFDIPLVFHRSIINNLRPPGCFHMNHKPWTPDCFDTMKQWAGMRGHISQDMLARLLDLDTQETTGADIAELYERDERDKIREKCAFDVEQNRQIYYRIVRGG